MDIGTKIIDDVIVNQLILSIKTKKEFIGIENSLIKKEIKNVLKRNNILCNYLLSKKISFRSDKFKKIVKLVRATLRQKYSMFIVNLNQRDKLLEKLKDINDKELRNKLLKLHVSSKERIPLYDFLFEDIFKLTGEPKTILDLGCGFNPIAFPFDKYNVKYYASDISKSDCDFLNYYFKKIDVECSAKSLDLTLLNKKKNLLEIFPFVDICFLLKLLESIELKGHKLAELLLENIKAKWIVVSFPKKKLSGKRMNRIERKWFEKICERKKYSFKKLDYENEFFYIVKK